MIAGGEGKAQGARRRAIARARPTGDRAHDDRPEGARQLGFTVQYGVSSATLPAPATLRRWAKAAAERTALVTVRFVGRREGQTLNAHFRGKEYATNVLAFVYDGSKRIEGDIVLCAPVVRDEARREGKTLADHCAHLVVHGMLHLQGYDHDTVRAARAMEKRETAVLAALGVADPYSR